MEHQFVVPPLECIACTMPRTITEEHVDLGKFSEIVACFFAGAHFYFVVCFYRPRCQNVYADDALSILPNEEECICGDELASTHGLGIKRCAKGEYCLIGDGLLPNGGRKFDCFPVKPDQLCPVTQWKTGGEFNVASSCMMPFKSNNGDKITGYEGVFLDATSTACAACAYQGSGSLELTLAGDPNNHPVLSIHPQNDVVSVFVFSKG